jgi:hypothetical protein
MILVEGIIRRELCGKEREIPFLIKGDGTFAQWGHDTLLLGENVDLLEAMRDAVCDEEDLSANAGGE